MKWTSTWGGEEFGKVNKGSGVKDAGMLWTSFTDGPKAKT